MLDPIVPHNKTPAKIQITAEQIILESNSRQLDRPRLDELDVKSMIENEDLKFKRRQAWEKSVRRNLCSYETYIRYAKWEEQMESMENARSVYERALEFTRFREIKVWQNYINFEIRHQQTAYVRNLYERGVTILPRYDVLWLDYAYFEESIGNVENARKIFQRWLAWVPPVHAYLNFINFEKRQKELDRARSIFERLLIDHSIPDSYLQYYDFESKMKKFSRCRSILERGLETFGSKITEVYLLKFAEFEESMNEIERAKAIYKFGLENLPESDRHELLSKYLQFEKRYGGNLEIELAIYDNQIQKYMEEIRENPYDYDTYYELCSLYQKLNKVDEALNFYEEVKHKVPLVSEEKSQWSCYVLLMISYANFCELTLKDIDKSRAILDELIKMTLNKKLSFGKLWIHRAFLEVRQENIAGARQIFGTAIAQCPKCSVFNSYIEMESCLKESNRVRAIFDKYIELVPGDVRPWINYAMFESRSGDINKAREIFKKAIAGEEAYNMKLIWSFYIDFEYHNGDLETVSKLFEESLNKDPEFERLQNWIEFEASDRENIPFARQLFQKGDLLLAEQKIERVKLRQYRVKFEQMYSDDNSYIEEAINMLPKEVDGEYIFPEENSQAAERLIQLANDLDYSD